MRWTKEEREQLKEKIRLLLITNPRISKYKLSKILGINKDVALRLKKEVVAENTKRISKQKIEEEIGKLEAEYEQLALECWRIITNNTRKVKKNKDGKEVEVEVEITPREKMNAVKTLIEAKKTLFNIKFDAGVFKRDLGKVESIVDLINKLEKEK